MNPIRVQAVSLRPVLTTTATPANGGIVPPWLRKPPVIVLPVEPHGVTVYPLMGASS